MYYRTLYAILGASCACLLASRVVFHAFAQAARWRANQHKNRLQALTHALWGKTVLRLLPGQGSIRHNRACQEQHPVCQHNQQGPGVAGFGALEAGQGLTQRLSVKAPAWLNRPAVGLSAPNGVHGDLDVWRKRLDFITPLKFLPKGGFAQEQNRPNFIKLEIHIKPV